VGGWATVDDPEAHCRIPSFDTAVSQIFQETVPDKMEHKTTPVGESPKEARNCRM